MNGLLSRVACSPCTFLWILPNCILFENSHFDHVQITIGYCWSQSKSQTVVKLDIKIFYEQRPLQPLTQIKYHGLQKRRHNQSLQNLI